MIEMIVIGLTIDPTNNSPIILLKEKDGDRTLPIWIGLLEATAIASELEKISFTRPLTHDLFINVLKATNCSLLRIEVVDISDNTFYACLYINNHQNEILKVDARPSDAIALALRARAPLFVNPQLLGISGHSSGSMELDQEKWLDLLERMNPEDFGKYKM